VKGLDGGLWKWNVSLCGNSARGTRREGSFTGVPEEYVKEGSRNGHLYIEAPLEDHEGRVPLPGTLRR
jgi:hypothetical protein